MISHILLNAIIASVLAGSICGILGVFMIRLKLNTIGFSSAHAALAGAALGVFLNVNPSILSLILAILVAIILGPLSDKLRLPLDLVSMVLFSLFTSLAFIFIFLSPGTALSAQAVTSVLWGSVLAITHGYLVLLACLFFSIILFVQLFKMKLLAILYDRRLAEAEGIPTNLYLYFLIFLIGITVALVLRITGGFLVFSLLFNPSAASLQISNNIRKILILAPFLGSSSALLGLLISYILNFPVGASIALASSTTLLVSVLISPKVKIK